MTGCCGGRRQFIWELGAGFGGVALSSMLDQDGFFSKHAFGADQDVSSTQKPLAERSPHFFPRAKRAAHLLKGKHNSCF